MFSTPFCTDRTKLDAICKSLFGEDQGLVSTKEETPELIVTAEMFAHHLWLMKHFPILGKLARGLPDSWANLIAPGYIAFRRVKCLNIACLTMLTLS